MRKRIISFVLVLAILLVSVPIVNSVSSDAAVLFIPRLEAPNDATNKYYRTKSAGGWNPAIEGNKDYSDHVAGSVLRNCVGYANGRFNEEAGYGKCKYTYAGNAENFWSKMSSSLERGQTPRVGAIMCWRTGKAGVSSDGVGHVAIVEKVISDTEVLVSESGWNSYHWKLTTRKKGSGNWGASSSKTFQGFIYNPDVVEDTYLPQCTYYPSYGTITVGSGSSVVKSLPCSNATNTSSEDIETATGKTYTETGIYKNTADNYWYRVETSSGKVGYVYSGNVDYCVLKNDAAVSSDRTIPVNIKQGNAFPTKGTVSTTYSRLESVYACIKSGNAVIYEKTEAANQNSLSLYNSGINAAMKFKELSVGDYTYVVTGTVTNYIVGYSTNNNTIHYITETVNLINADFTVSSNDTITAEFSNIEIVNITDNSAGVTWRCDITGAMNNIVSESGLYLYDANGNNKEKVYSQTESLSGQYNYFYAKSTPYPITGLVSGTMYKVQVYAILSGKEVCSEMVSFTAGSESSTISNVEATYTVTISNITSTSASVAYRCDITTPGIKNDMVSRIGMYLYESDGEQSQELYTNNSPNLSGNNAFFINNDIPVENLEPSTNYTVQIYSVISGKTICSDYYQFTTSALTTETDYFNYSKEPVDNYMVVMNGNATLYSSPDDNGQIASLTVNGKTMNVVPRYYVVYADYKGSNSDGELYYHLVNRSGFVCDQLEGTYVKAELLTDLQIGRYIVCPFSGSAHLSIRSDPTIVSNNILLNLSAGESFYFTGDLVYGYDTEANKYGSFGSVKVGNTTGWAKVGYFVYDATHTHSFGEYVAADDYGHTRTCSDCGYVEYSDHSIVSDAAIAATCISSGSTAGSHCTVCGYISAAQETIPATGHNYGTPTWTWTGFTTATAKFVCANDPSHIQNVNATITSATTTAATCTTAGVKTYTATVTFEGQTYTNTKTGTIPAIGHNYGAPTWTWTGFTAATAKFVCANDPSHIQNVNATITSAVTTAAKCTTEGVKTYTATVTFNGQTYTNTKTETIPATGHNYGTPTYTWASDYSSVTATRTCANDSSHKETETVNTSSEITKQPTYEANGETTYTAVFTNSAFSTQTKTVSNIPKLEVEATVTVESKKVRPGDEFTISVSFENFPAVKSLAFSNVIYDHNALELIDAEWKVANTVMARWDENTGKGVAAFSSAQNINGVVFQLSFKAKDAATDGNYQISITADAKDASNNAIDNVVNAGIITVQSVLLGDLNGDDQVNDEDAIYLLFYTFFPEDYPLNQEGDFNGDGMVNDEDAIYLLFYTFFPEDYPLN